MVFISLMLSAALNAGLAMYQWFELITVRRGGSTVCSVNETVNCATVWNSPFASAVHDTLGMNSRLDEVQAALLRSVLLPDLGPATERRRAIADRYRREIRSPHVELVPVPEKSESVWHLFPVLVRGDRERFRAALAAKGIQSGVHYPTLTSDQRALEGVDFVREGDLPRARDFAAREVSLPMHRYLTDEQVARVVAACNAFE